MVVRMDALLGSLPEDADTYYLHDIAMLPEARGQEVVSQPPACRMHSKRGRGVSEHLP